MLQREEYCPRGKQDGRYVPCLCGCGSKRKQRRRMTGLRPSPPQPMALANTLDVPSDFTSVHTISYSKRTKEIEIRG